MKFQSKMTVASALLAAIALVAPACGGGTKPATPAAGAEKKDVPPAKPVDTAKPAADAAAVPGADAKPVDAAKPADAHAPGGDAKPADPHAPAGDAKPAAGH